MALKNPLKRKPAAKKVVAKKSAPKKLSVKETVKKEYNEGKNYADLMADHKLTLDEVEGYIGAIAHETVYEEPAK
jgi:hypothetical protein